MKILIVILLVFMSFDLRDWKKLGSSAQENLKVKAMIEYFNERPDCGQATIEVYENIRTKEVEFYVNCEKREI